MAYLLLILAVAIGFFIGHKISAQHQYLTRLMAFSGAFLLSLTVLEILPEVYEAKTDYLVGLFILGGILLQLVLELFSQGAEHGHIHEHNHNTGFPILLFTGLSIHALLEGLPIEENNHMLWGILIHKIPESIMLTLFLIHSKINYKYIITCMAFFALMTPLGGYLAKHSEWVNLYQVPIHAVVIGVFLHLSTTLLFESNKNHSFNISKLVFILFGMLLAFIL